MPEQKLERGGMRELGTAAEAAVVGVIARAQALARRRERSGGQRRKIVAARRLHVGERVDQMLAALANLILFASVVLIDRDEHLAKRRHAVTALLRKIRADEDGDLLRRQEHGQRPAAALARHQLMA